MATEGGSRPRVMVDTSILIAGIGWPRWSYEVLLAGVRGEYQLVLSPYVLKEARRVLAKRFPQHVQRFERFVERSGFELVTDPSFEEVTANRNLMRDTSDIPIALAAIAAGVDYFVSEDKDFTMRNQDTEQLHARLEVRLSGTFLREVLGWSGAELDEIRRRTWSDMEREAGA